MRQFLLINTQANHRINHGQMLVRSIIRWALAIIHHRRRHRSTNVAVPMVMPLSPITFERRNVNIKNESIKLNATNRHIQRLVIYITFRGPKFTQPGRFSFTCEMFSKIVGPTADAMASSDEDEQAANNNNNNSASSNNHLRHETEDDGLFPFRRSNANQYHRVCFLSLCSIA